MVTYIYSVTDLSNIRNNLSGDYELKSDIYIGNNWSPIGDPTNKFTGTLTCQTDGGVPLYSLTNLQKTGYQSFFGVFGVIDGATISNISIKDTALDTYGNHIGLLVGRSYDSLLDNIYIDATMQPQNVISSGGGVCATIDNSAIINCKVKLSITNSSYMLNDVGGIVGNASNSCVIHSNEANVKFKNTNTLSTNIGGIGGSIFDSSLAYNLAHGTIEFDGDNVGGNFGIVSECNNINTNTFAGIIYGNNAVGGNIGYVYDTSVSNLFSLSYVNGYIGVGGCIGETADISDNANKCLFIGNIKGNNKVAGIIGKCDGNYYTVSNSISLAKYIDSSLTTCNRIYTNSLNTSKGTNNYGWNKTYVRNVQINNEYDNGINGYDIDESEFWVDSELNSFYTNVLGYLPTSLDMTDNINCKIPFIKAYKDIFDNLLDNDIILFLYSYIYPHVIDMTLSNIVPSANPTVKNTYISFYANCSQTPDSWHWDFGDGYRSTDEAPTHYFNSAGTFIVRVKVNKSGFQEAQRTMLMKVHD